MTTELKKKGEEVMAPRMKTVKVLVSMLVEVQVKEGDDHVFQIEDNGCPGTGVVGTAIERAIRSHKRASTCWACAFQGENTIVPAETTHLEVSEYGLKRDALLVRLKGASATMPEPKEPRA